MQDIDVVYYNVNRDVELVYYNEFAHFEFEEWESEETEYHQNEEPDQQGGAEAAPSEET